MNNKLYQHLLNSLIDPVLLVDTNHKIIYMNKAAAQHYSEGYSLLNSSIMDCHNKASCETMLAIFAKMETGLDEEIITDDAKQRIYMRAVRDENNHLIGYYERYERKASAG